MRKIKQVLRLHSMGLKQREIARACAIGQSTVSEYVKLAESAGVNWPDVVDLDDDQIIAKLVPAPSPEPDRSRLPKPDFPTIHHELKTNKHVTLQLLWEEYRGQFPDGYGYSRFCELYQRWRRKQDVVMRQEHRPGEKLLSIMPAPPSGSETRKRAKCGRHSCSSECSARATTRTQN